MIFCICYDLHEEKNLIPIQRISKVWFDLKRELKNNMNYTKPDGS